MGKLSKRELDVLTDVIYVEVTKQRLEKVQKSVEGREDFKELMERVEGLVKKKAELKKEIETIEEGVDKIKKELNLSYSGSSNGCIRFDSYNLKLSVEERYVSKEDINSRLVLENLGKDIDVDTLIDKLTKIFVN